MKTIIFPDGVALLDETRKEVTFRNTISKLPQNSPPGLGDIVIIDGRSGIVTEYNPAIYGNVSGKVTQTIKPHDFAYMVEMSGIHGGSTVLESGVGSGQLTAALLWAVGTGGSVVSVDLSERNLQIARENLSLHHDISNWRPVLGDIGNFSSDILFDSVFLDIPDPWNYADKVKKILKAGHHLVTYSPNFNQTEKTVISYQEAGFVHIETCEILKRNLLVRHGMTRPSSEMLGHTAFISHLINATGFTSRATKR